MGWEGTFFFLLAVHRTWSEPQIQLIRMRDRLDFILEAEGDRVSLAMVNTFLSIKLLEECSFI